MPEVINVIGFACCHGWPTLGAGHQGRIVACISASAPERVIQIRAQPKPNGVIDHVLPSRRIVFWIPVLLGG